MERSKFYVNDSEDSGFRSVKSPKVEERKSKINKLASKKKTHSYDVTDYLEYKKARSLNSLFQNESNLRE